MKNVSQVPRIWKTRGELISPLLVFLMLVLLGTLCLGVGIGVSSPIYAVAITSILALAFILISRLDELALTLIVAIHILVDGYLDLGKYQIALLLTLVLLSTCYLGRSADHPWTRPRLIWLWIVFLILNIYPTINGTVFSLTYAINFYLDLVLGAFIMFWLGNMIAKDISATRRVFQLLAVLAALIALHTIIQATTGKFLFETSASQGHLIQYGNFQAQGAVGTSRYGSFFSTPDGDGAFLATCFFLPLGLFIESKRLRTKVIYFLEMLLILVALMFTYSAGSLIAVLIGIVVFMFLVGRIRSFMLLIVSITTIAVLAYIVAPSWIATELAHANDQSHISDHQGTIQTAVRVIEAYPLFGVGLDDQAYLVRAEPYRSPLQSQPQAEPDNSYLQWGATSGIPVMLVFILLLGFVFWFAWRNWLAIEIRYRALLGGGLVALIALSISSLGVDGWTNAAGIEYLGWLIAGIIASPFLTRCLHQQSASQLLDSRESQSTR